MNKKEVIENKEYSEKEIMRKLQEPFPESDIEWRIQSSGINRDGKPWAKILAYVTNRAIQERLDSIFGVLGWKNVFMKAPDGGVLCGISIKDETFGGHGWITKWDGAENTQFEPIKGGLSNAMKRAAVQFGIGRYLYNLKINWAIFEENGKYRDKIEKEYYNWNPPKLPMEFLPSEKKEPFKDTKETGVKEEVEEPVHEWKDYHAFGSWLYEMVNKKGMGDQAPASPELEYFQELGTSYFAHLKAFNEWLEMKTEKLNEDGSVKWKGKTGVGQIKNLKQLNFLYITLRKDRIDKEEAENK